jgi:asparagine synthetase B (glutamine-hydrolysing)
MCGIIGVISKKNNPDFQSEFIEPLSQALNRMEYRGPDNKGIWSENGICFGHRM